MEAGVVPKADRPEFAELMSKAEVSATAFAYVSSQKLLKIHEWVSGLDEKGNTTMAPHWSRVLLEIFAKFPQSFDFALDLTEKFTSQRRPSKTTDPG